MVSRLKRQNFHFSQLELYECFGILFCLPLIIVFVVNTKRLAPYLSLHNPHPLLWTNVYGLITEKLTLLFISVFTVLLLLLSLARRKHVQFLPPHGVFIIRVLLSFLMMMVVYKAVNFYIYVFHPETKDFALQEMDKNLFFGKLPSQWFLPFMHPALTKFFGMAYLSWFGMTYLTIFLLLTHSQQATREYVTTAILTFYIGYITYIFVPAIGPIFTVHYPQTLGAITSFLVSNTTPIARDCFPSLHTGLSVVMTTHIYRYHRKWLWFYLPWSTIIVFSTLYLRIHYGVDVIAGAALAIATCQLAPLYTRAWSTLQANRRQNPVHRGAQRGLSTETLSELA